MDITRRNFLFGGGMAVGGIVATSALPAIADDEDWIRHGPTAWELIRHFRSGNKMPNEFNAVVEQTPPYAFATQCQAELFWSSKDDWETIARRARMRARPERYAHTHTP